MIKLQHCLNVILTKDIGICHQNISEIECITKN